MLNIHTHTHKTKIAHRKWKSAAKQHKYTAVLCILATMVKRTQTFVCVVNSVRFIIYTHNDIADYRNIKKWCDGRKLKVVTIIEILRTKLIQSIGVVRYISLLFALFFYKVRAMFTFLSYSTCLFLLPRTTREEEKKHTGHSRRKKWAHIIIYTYIFCSLALQVLYFHFLFFTFTSCYSLILLSQCKHIRRIKIKYTAK